jgi:hypothetical protein
MSRTPPEEMEGLDSSTGLVLVLALVQPLMKRRTNTSLVSIGRKSHLVERLRRPCADSKWAGNMGCVTVTYNHPLGEYLMCVTDGVHTDARMNSYILEADQVTGPWRMAVYMKDFGEQAYFLNIPGKFISPDGLSFYLCYSANFSQMWNGVDLEVNPPGSSYSMTLQHVRLS